MISIAAFPKCWLDDISSGRMKLSDWIDASVELECQGLEMYWRFFPNLEPAYLAGIRKQVESHGMSIPMMCHSPDFTVPDEDGRKKEMETQKEMIRMTAELGGRFCRTLSGQRRPEVKVEQGINWVVACIEECIPVAESCGVKLVIENHYKDGSWLHPEFAQKKDVFLQILNRIQSPVFGVQYDPSNALVAGEDPIALLDEVLPRVMTMHASDRYLLPGTSLDDLRKADGTIGYTDKLMHGVTGQGLNDYDAIISRLVKSGFDGWISIEDGMNGMEEMKASVTFLKRILKKFAVQRPERLKEVRQDAGH